MDAIKKRNLRREGKEMRGTRITDHEEMRMTTVRKETNGDRKRF